MAKMDLGKLSYEELIELRNDIDKELRKKEKQRIEEARAAVEARARELGFSVAQLFSAKPATGSKNPPKYRNPENPAKTWSGRGRQPNWVKSHLAAGGKLDDLAI